MKTHLVKSKCPENTMDLAELIGRSLKGDEVIELIGDFGSGKTTFVKGLVKGTGSKDSVSSPSFAIENIYKGKVQVRHLDLYRLDEAGLAGYSLQEHIGEGEVVVIEWAGLANDVLPDCRLKVNFELGPEEMRQIKFSFPDMLDYLLQGIKS